ncbi:MAG: hypothetical protein VKL59_17075 [Nostocaceae cyanobacterium]|nr:hypothetical protein [Nostocaceae cyanobacterium]
MTLPLLVEGNGIHTDITDRRMMDGLGEWGMGHWELQTNDQ